MPNYNLKPLRSAHEILLEARSLLTTIPAKGEEQVHIIKMQWQYNNKVCLITREKKIFFLPKQALLEAGYIMDLKKDPKLAFLPFTQEVGELKLMEKKIYEAITGDIEKLTEIALTPISRLTTLCWELTRTFQSLSKIYQRPPNIALSEEDQAILDRIYPSRWSLSQKTYTETLIELFAYCHSALDNLDHLLTWSYLFQYQDEARYNAITGMAVTLSFLQALPPVTDLDIDRNPLSSLIERYQDLIAKFQNLKFEKSKAIHFDERIVTSTREIPYTDNTSIDEEEVSRDSETSDDEEEVVEDVFFDDIINPRPKMHTSRPRFS